MRGLIFISNMMCGRVADGEISVNTFREEWATGEICRRRYLEVDKSPNFIEERKRMIPAKRGIHAQQPNYLNGKFYKFKNERQIIAKYRDL